MILIPVGIEGETLKRMPYVSITIALICVLAFFATWVLPPNPLGESEVRRLEAFEYWSEHPNAALPESLQSTLPVESAEAFARMHADAVEQLGPADADTQAELDRQAAAVADAGESTLIRFSLKKDRSIAQLGVFTYMFLHLGWMHIIFNLLFFYMCGPLLEGVWGRPLFTGFFLFGGIAAGVTEWALTRHHSGYVVGASGAVAACMGAFSVRFATSRVRMGYLFFIGLRVFRGTFAMAAWIAGGLWVAGEVWSLVSGDSSGVAVLAHIGGFVFGAVAAVGMKALDIEKKYIEGVLENEGVAYVRPTEMDEAQRALDDGDLVTARRLASELLKKSPDVLEAEVLMYRVERRQSLANAANARLERLLDKVLRKEDPVALHGVLVDLGGDFEPKSVRPGTAARLVEQLDGSNGSALGRRAVMELIEIGSAASGVVGARLLLRRADEAMREGAHDQARSLIDAAKTRVPDAQELRAQLELLERRLQAEASAPAAAAQPSPSAPPRIRLFAVAGADDAGLELQDDRGKKGKLPWARIQAVAAALAPSGADATRFVPVTDLVLSWGDVAKGAEVVRVAAPSLGLGILFPGVPPKEAYALWLRNAVERSGATVLPDKGAVLSGQFTKYGSVDELNSALYGPRA